MSAEQPYTDEAMKDALMTELALCLFNDLTVSETTGRVWAVIAAAMAEKDAEIARLREAVQGLLDMPGNLDTDCNPPEAQQLVLAARLKAWANARQTLKPESPDHD
jgi:hypothetical protein